MSQAMKKYYYEGPTLYFEGGPGSTGMPPKLQELP